MDSEEVHSNLRFINWKPNPNLPSLDDQTNWINEIKLREIQRKEKVFQLTVKQETNQSNALLMDGEGAFGKSNRSNEQSARRHVRVYAGHFCLVKILIEMSKCRNVEFVF